LPHDCRKGKRSALVDHQTKSKEHKQLVQDMELGLKRVMLVGGVAQRLLGKVAIVTGDLSILVAFRMPPLFVSLDRLSYNGLQ